MTIRYVRFRDDLTEYAASKAEWTAVFDTMLGSDYQSGWEDWLQDPFHEGAPVFSRIHYALRKGIVINQILPSDDDLHFRAYTDTFADDSTTDRVDFVSVTTVLAEGEKIKVARLLEAWLRPDATLPEMERLCESLTGDVALDHTA